MYENHLVSTLSLKKKSVYTTTKMNKKNTIIIQKCLFFSFHLAASDITANQLTSKLDLLKMMDDYFLSRDTLIAS